jgi:hypothetical protein
VLEPESLRQELRETARRLVALYENTDANGEAKL